jgi:Protein of unknown function (DUF1153)
MTSISRHADQVIGPSGMALTLADLPSENGGRWMPLRKAQIIAAVTGGLLSLPEACARYRISGEEFNVWVDAYERFGLAGLRAGRRGVRPPAG